MTANTFFAIDDKTKNVVKRLKSNDVVMVHVPQWFPTCLGLRHPAEENYILRHPVANPYNFASRFDDSLKMYF